MNLQKIFSLIATGACCLCLFVLGSYMLDEGYNPVVPGVDTKYAAQYDEAKFSSIKEGMDTSEVIGLIGQPMGKRGNSTQMWHYTADGNCKWADFAWLDRNLVIDNTGKVKMVNKVVGYY